MKVIVLSSYPHLIADKLKKLGCEYKNPMLTLQRYMYNSEEHESRPTWWRVVDSELNTLESHLDRVDAVHFPERTYFPFVGIFDATEPPVVNATEDGSILITADHTADKRSWEFKSEFFARRGCMCMYPEYYRFGDVEFEWTVLVDGKAPDASVKLYSILAQDIGVSGNGIVCTRASVAGPDGDVYTYEDGSFGCWHPDDGKTHVADDDEIRAKLQQEWCAAMQQYEASGLSWPCPTTTDALLYYVEKQAMVDPVDG